MLLKELSVMGTLQEKVRRFQKKTITELRERQNADGSWTFCFEGPIMTNSFFILLLTSLDEGKNEKELISSLAAAFMQNSSQTAHLSTIPMKRAEI